jgi:hypothetical protein
MRLEPKPALKATLYLALWVGLIVLIVLLPSWVVAAVMIPAVLGMLWWLMYTTFRDRDRLKKELELHRLKSYEAAK